MKVQITSWYSGAVLFETEVDKPKETNKRVLLRACLLAALAAGADLSGANLIGADLIGANLIGANLSGANLSGANLRSASLRSANLSGANLIGASLSGASLRSASLSGASLSGANLSGANLIGASLSGASLSGANLSGANLSGANLRSASLSGANLIGANLSEARGLAFQIPQEGELIVWKKTTSGLVKLRVPPEAKRTASLIGRKCRAEFVEVLEAPADARSTHDRVTIYAVGQVVRPDAYNDDPRLECTNGIHFFLSKEEAESYR